MPMEKNMGFGAASEKEKPSIKKMQLKLEWLLFQKGLLLFVVGLLLGRALILTHLAPFALPYFAAVFVMKRNQSPIALVGLLLGSLTLSFQSMVYTFSAALFFIGLYKATAKLRKENVYALPYITFIVVFFSKLTTLYLDAGFQLTIYDGLISGLEASLAFILTLIFMQSIPLLSIKKTKKSLKTEEVVSLVILLSSVLTGTIGWSMYDLSVEHILSRYLVILFAFVAGATVGSTVGVVTGLIFSLANVTSLYQLSLLAFAGLLGGLMKEGKKLGVASGLMIATLLMAMYGDSSGNILPTLIESGVAALLLFLTPTFLTQNLAKHIPGTAENYQEQHQYLSKIRDVTSSRVAQFGTVFQALAKSFDQLEHGKDELEEEREIDFLLSNVTEKTCQTCFKKEHCWVRNFDETYNVMKDVIHEYENGPVPLTPKLHKDLKAKCSRSQQVLQAISKELTFYQANIKLKQQVKESRKLVSEQLKGVSEVMNDFAQEIQKEQENHYALEEEILHNFSTFGVDVERVEIYSLDKGNVDIEVTIPYTDQHGMGEKLVAPMLSEILGETIIISKIEKTEFATGPTRYIFGSAQNFKITTGVANAAKDGGLISGDSYSMIELGAGKYAVAISDGMGNGERAHSESNETLRLLQQILQSGIKEKVAIKSVNSILSLRTTDEIFSTLDLAIIDLHDASSRFLKVGSSPSFIKRGSKMVKVESGNLPMGIFYEFDVEIVSEQLKAGDILVMMSDGIFEGPKHVENYEMWIKRKIAEIETSDPQDIADIIMEEVIRSRSGDIEDDMTVLVTRIDHNTPRWANIPANQYSFQKSKIS
ncbi:stage II sporulation protein E [Bacillus coahuilensis p1.1.43]|uniref:Stage II sporulation protein E n=2 Tax=Bacillus coahuilensis TaxID=408580 RepID=A0A147K4W9_9BACI|nr:stage II sporulation protein E [Bacillus coahuilensis p1.1.43]